MGAETTPRELHLQSLLEPHLRKAGTLKCTAQFEGSCRAKCVFQAAGLIRASSRQLRLSESLHNLEMKGSIESFFFFLRHDEVS